MKSNNQSEVKMFHEKRRKRERVRPQAETKLVRY